MKYYSEVLDKVFDSEKDCKAAETAEQERISQRDTQLKELEEKLDKLNELEHELREKLVNTRKEISSVYDEIRELKEEKTLSFEDLISLFTILP